MGNSFEKVFGKRHWRDRLPMHASPRCSGKRPPHSRHFRAVFAQPGTRAPPVRLYPRNPVRYDPAAIRPTHGRKFMHITVAHISPILSLLAGVLILIMPRLLNLIVAIFLIINGAIGLGLLKWLHL
jgi:DUF3096 family protein